jgi:hypothetical protein
MQKLSRPWKILLGFAVAFWLMIGMMVLFSSESKTPEQLKTDAIEKHFDPWDGSHRELTKAIKAYLKDPDSYEHVSTTYQEEGEFLMVKTTYRASNSFGGITLESVVGVCDPVSGKVIQWESVR